LDLRQRTLREGTQASLASMSHLSLCYAKLGHYQKARTLGEEVLTTTRIFGRGHPNTITAMMLLTAFYHKLGLFRESLHPVEDSRYIRSRSSFRFTGSPYWGFKSILHPLQNSQLQYLQFLEVSPITLSYSPKRSKYVKGRKLRIARGSDNRRW
jgi:hypothetical protein